MNHTVSQIIFGNNEASRRACRGDKGSGRKCGERGEKDEPVVEPVQLGRRTRGCLQLGSRFHRSP